MSKTIRVMVVDDHPIVREGLRLMLATSDDLLLVGDAAEGTTERTVRAYLTTIYTKLNVDSRASAVAVAMERGLLPEL